jgi:hypothetical protein
MPFFKPPKSGDVDPSSEGYEDTIKNRLGHFSLWHLTWDPRNWLKIRTSKEWVYSIIPQPEVEAAGEEDVEDEPCMDDGDHILLFPMDYDGLCPRVWFKAAWAFLEHFRSNFCFYPQEAFMYKKVTLIGRPLNTRFGVAQEIEADLKAADWRQVERIWCASAQDLESVLQQRIDQGLRFRGRDELAP